MLALENHNESGFICVAINVTSIFQVYTLHLQNSILSLVFLSADPS